MKLSKHPVGTVINVRLEGRFEKVPSGLWRDLTDHRRFFTNKFMRKIQKNHPEDITILAAPWSVVVELMQMVMDEYGHRDSEGNLITFDSVYKDAIARDESTKRIEAQQERIVQNYCTADVEATTRFFDRVMRSHDA